MNAIHDDIDGLQVWDVWDRATNTVWDTVTAPVWDVCQVWDTTTATVWDVWDRVELDRTRPASSCLIGS